MKYVHAIDYKDFIVTHYKSRETHEFVVKWTEKIGPISLETDEGEDIVFTLDGIDGLFVSSKKNSIVLEIHD